MRQEFDELMGLMESLSIKDIKMEIQFYFYNDTLWMAINRNDEIWNEWFLRRGGYNKMFSEAIEYLSNIIQNVKMIELLLGKFNGIKLPKNFWWER